MRVAQGDLAGALAAYEEGLASPATSPPATRATPAGPRRLGQPGQVGDVRVAQGDLAGALAAYEESLSIGRDLAARDPGNAGWARDLSVSLNKVGDVSVGEGDLAGALAAYEESLASAATSPPATRATPAGPATSRSA